MDFKMLLLHLRLSAMAFPVILLVLSICGGGGANFFTKHPEDTLAVVGQNVAFSCIATIPYCDYKGGKGYLLYWRRGAQSENSVVLSSCTDVYEIFDNKYEVSSSKNEWTLHIKHVTQQNDGEQYLCYIFDYTNQKTINSEVATLSVVQPINTVVNPPCPSREEGGTVTFHCITRIQSMDKLSYSWYINGTLKEHPMPDRFQFSDNGLMFTIIRLNMKFNSTEVTCKLFRGSVLLSSQSESALLLVYPKNQPTQPTTDLFSTDEAVPVSSDGQADTFGTVAVQTPTNASPNYEADVTLDAQPPVHPTSSQGTHENNTDSKNSNTSSDLAGTTAVMAGGAVAAALLTVVIAFLLYVLLYKGRPKPNVEPTCESGTTEDDGLGASVEGTAETQMSLPATTARLVSSDETLVKPPKTSVTMEVAVDSDQQPETKRKKGSAEKILPVDTKIINKDTKPAEDGEKRHTIGGKGSEALYAVPDKSLAKTKTLNTTKAQKPSKKVTEESVRKFGGPNHGPEDKLPQKPADDSQDELDVKNQKPTVAVKPFSGPEGVMSRQPSGGVKPPRVIPHRLSKRRAQRPIFPELTGDDEDGEARGDPRQQNAEGLIYADLDLSRGAGGGGGGGATIIQQEEETVYAAIVNQKTVGKLREGNEAYASGGGKGL